VKGSTSKSTEARSKHSRTSDQVGPVVPDITIIKQHKESYRKDKTRSFPSTDGNPTMPCQQISNPIRLEPKEYNSNIAIRSIHCYCCY
jgi:hypothetical protein